MRRGGVKRSEDRGLVHQFVIGPGALICSLLLFSALALLPQCALGSFEGTAEHPSIDGLIAPGEYEHEVAFSGDDFTLCWQVEDGLCYFAMMAFTEGYLAIGFDPGFLMEGADMVVGWVDEDGTVNVIDAYSPGRFGPVTRDLDLGGRDDVLMADGTERDGVTVIEFVRALNTADDYDKDILQTGELRVMWATGTVFDVNIPPNDGGFGVIDMTSDVTTEPSLHLYYLVGLTVCLGSLLAAASVELIWKRTAVPWVHGSFAVAGLTAAVIVMFLAYLFDPSASGDPALWAVMVGLAALIITILTGRRAGRSSDARSIGVHRWGSLVPLLAFSAAMVLTLLS